MEEVRRKLDGNEPPHLLDIREPEELSICAISGSEHISMIELFAGLKRTAASRDTEVVVFCHVGLRSYEAARYLRLLITLVR